MKELKKQWKNELFERCYLFYGPETYLISNYEKTLVHALLSEDEEAMNLERLEEKRATAEKIMDACDTMPFFAPKRVVVVKNSAFFQKGNAKEEGEKLLSYLETLPDSCCLLFIEEKVEKNSRLYKAVVKYGQAIEFKTPSESDLVAWIKKECKQAGLKMEQSVIHRFLQTVEPNMESMERELQKLIAYKAEQSEILGEDIAAVCTASLESKVFDLVRAVAEQQSEKALRMYRTLLLLKESPYMILSLITRQFRFILESALLSKQGCPNAEVAQRLEIRDFAVREYLKQSNRMPIEAWQRALADCLKTDLAIKSGQMGEEIAVEVLILRYGTKK